MEFKKKMPPRLFFAKTQKKSTNTYSVLGCTTIKQNPVKQPHITNVIAYKKSFGPSHPPHIGTSEKGECRKPEPKMKKEMSERKPK